MYRPPPQSTNEPTPQQQLATRIVWFGQTIGSALIIAGVMFFALPEMGIELPRFQLAPREVLVGGVVVLGVVCFIVAKVLRDRLYAPPLPAAAAPSGAPVQQALARLNANSALVGGILNVPFMVGVAIFLVSRDPWLLAAGIWPPLLGGLVMWPDPLRACRELLSR
jgi:hypothetical protein